jgi:CRP-like cAMP-binding protein
MLVTEIMPGCKVFSSAGHQPVLFGQPSEVLKVFAGKKADVPEIMVLPSMFYEFGVMQAGMEFLLYHFLFVKQGFFTGKKLYVVGTGEQNERMRQILRLTLIGPTKRQMKDWGIEPAVAKQALKLSYYFGLKMLGSKTKLAKISDMVEFINFENDQATVGGLRIEVEGHNTFRVTATDENVVVDINISEPQEPPLPMPMPSELPPRPILGATALSKCSTGFDTTGYTSGLLLWINSMGVSVDGVSWMKKHLRSLGINPHEIKAHIVTHIHDDHSNILDLIVNGEKFYLISDKLGYNCIVEKVSLILGIPRSGVEEMINLVEITPGKPLFWYGAKFEFWRTAHPVPTLGFRATLNSKSIVYSGDTVWGTKLQKLCELGVVTKEMCDILQNVPSLKSEVTFHDAGGGMIHPDLNELALLSEQTVARIVPTHLPFLPPEYSELFQSVTPGKSWVIIEEGRMQTGDLLRVLSSPLFSGISDMWRNVVLSQGRIIEYPSGYKVLEEGGIGRMFYVIVGGTVSVVINGEQVTELSTGDFFGERSLLSCEPCNASIVTRTPVKVMAIPRDIFKEMADGTRISQLMVAIYRIRPVLMKISLFASLPPSVQNRIAASAELVTFSAGEVIIEQGGDPDFLYVIQTGSADVTVRKNGGSVQERIATLGSGQVFGEIALLAGGKRTANVIAISAMQALRISKEQFGAIAGSTPMLKFSLGKLADSRRGHA